MNKVAMNAAVRKSNRLADKKMNEKDAKGFVSKFTRVFIYCVILRNLKLIAKINIDIASSKRFKVYIPVKPELASCITKCTKTASSIKKMSSNHEVTAYHATGNRY